VRNHSGLCEKVCVLLLRLELLRRLRPDLNPAEPGNLLNLAAGRGRRPSRLAAQLFKEARRSLKGASEPLDLIAAGLEELQSFAPTVAAENTVAQLAGMGIIIQPTDRPPPRTVAQVQTFIQAKPRPVGRLPARSSIRRLAELAGDEQVRELACAITSPLLIRGLGKGPPVVQGAAIAALSLCGFELLEDS